MKRIIVQLIIFILITGAGMAIAQNYKSGYEEVNGIRMYYEIHGNGDPLVLIHGGGSTIESTFGSILPSLADDFQVIAVELQAHGRTGDRDAPERFEQDADDIASLLAGLKIAKASFLGFSNGGNTAIQISVRHNEIVDRLVLASTFYKREGLVPGMFDGLKQATINDMPQSLKDAFLKVNPDSSKLLNMFNKDRERMLNFKDWDDKTISSINAPTLIINGDKDVVLTGHALHMSKLIADCRLMILPAEHGAYLGAVDFRENPDTGIVNLTAQVIKNFLNNK